MRLLAIAKELHEMATHLANLEGAIVLPVDGDCNLKGAIAKLAAAFPDTSFNIQPPDICYRAHTKEVDAEGWGVGIHHAAGSYEVYKGKTLTDAVNAALATLAPPSDDPVADVQAALTPAPF